MTKRTPLVVALVAVGICMLASGQQEPRQGQDENLPPGHPPLLPADHPPLTDADQPAPAPEAARPADVDTVDAIIAAYYDSISGAPGIERDWGRFQSLFLPGARLVSTTGTEQGTPIVLTPDIFARMNRKYFRSSGYREKSVHERHEMFGAVAHVWSTYEARRHAEEAPYSRGINSFQLLRSGQRWWIVAVAWDRERPGVKLAPEELPLPAGHP